MNLLRPTIGRLLLLTTLIVLIVAPSSGADVGGAAPGSGTPPAKSGGSGTTKPKKKRSRAVRRPAVLAGFTLSGAALTNGSRLTLRYRITGSPRRARVRAVVRTAKGTHVKTIELGLHRTNALVTTKLTAAELGASTIGAYKIRLAARDSASRSVKRARGVPVWRSFSLSDHRFPVTGPFSFGSSGARFGAGRPGHIHQGQDVIADSGTPIVAPYAGTISHVAYQSGGAGYYVVERANDGRDYVFMHMIKGSAKVKVADRVVAGQRLGRVGETGAASGPHLHFEIWTGGAWQFGGKPIDPLPLLKAWSTNDPTAVRTTTHP
jgi:murein DD-endopeptidase MepM/ murein hydrolase activator NlpD